MKEVATTIGFVLCGVVMGMCLLVSLDGRGLPDGEDVTWIETINEKNTKVLIKCKDRSTEWIAMPKCEHEPEKITEKKEE